MATISKFEELEIWQKSRLLSKDIYIYVDEGGFKRDYKLIEQINAASGSVMDNIAEGFERSSKLEFINFLSYSKGSVGEVKSQLYRALDRNYLSADKFQHFYDRADEITKMSTSLITYLNQATIKRKKFKDRL